MEKMHFTRMDEGTDEDFQVLKHVHERSLRELPERLLGHLRELRNDTAYNISRYDHCLQSATRALRDGKDEEYVVVALLHDACELLGPFNHGEVVASILRPFISRNNQWMLAQHGLFQTYYYAHHMGGDRNARERLRDHPWFGACAAFCERWDQSSFDPDYRTEPLETFEPLVRRIFSREAHDPRYVSATPA